MLEITNDIYDVFIAEPGKKALILGASWCKPCKALINLWDKYEDAPVAYVDLTNGKTGKIKRNINIEHIPLTVIFDGEKELNRYFGLYNPENIQELTLSPKPDGVKSCGN